MPQALIEMRQLEISSMRAQNGFIYSFND